MAGSGLASSSTVLLAKKGGAPNVCIFVNVYADGPIRVLHFTDNKEDHLSHETEEESLQLLARRLQRIEATMREVESRLAKYEISGAGAAYFRPPAHPHGPSLRSSPSL